MYIAHIRKENHSIQSVREHLLGVQKLSEQFGEKIGIKHLAGLAGMLHDLGKNSYGFKEYIELAVANPDNPPPKRIDHSTAGGRLLFQLLHTTTNDPAQKLVVEWVAMSIISHHSGLQDFLTEDFQSPFLMRVDNKQLPEYDHAVSEFFNTQLAEQEFLDYIQHAKSEVVQLLEILKNQALKKQPLEKIMCSLILKYIFSCLIDADRTDSRIFDEDENAQPSFDTTAFFQDCYNALLRQIKSYQNSPDAILPINMLRNKMSEQCEQHALHPSGIYKLSIPTGGGKTLASLRYALKHAIEYKKDRIIYIVPYTTIIEQNANEVRNILDLQNSPYILEHHSNIIENECDDPEDQETYDLKKRTLKLAKDNWDNPIIFTTMVQFLNTFYAKGTRNVRRLHNLANSIIIFDEVQAVPTKCVSLFNEALNFLHFFGQSSLILCTATQPALDFVQHKLHIPPGAEMITDIEQVSEQFKRVEVHNRTTATGYNSSDLKEWIVKELNTVDSILVILNTKTATKKLYELLCEDTPSNYKLFHLSTYMCAAHRQDVLLKLREALDNKKSGQKIICISTQLIEAGVDISFECVFRSLTGLDSIAQAAGRCNRHGKDAIRNVYIFNSTDEVLTNLKEICIGAEITTRVLNDFKENPIAYGNDLLSPQALALYFKYYLARIQNDLHYPIKELNQNMYDLLNTNKSLDNAYANATHTRLPLVSKQSFATSERYFNVIDNPTTAVLVPYNEEAWELLLDLNGELYPDQLSSLLRKAQRYVVNIYDHELKVLEKRKDISLLLNGNIYALAKTAYNRDFGLDLNSDGNWALAEI